MARLNPNNPLSFLQIDGVVSVAEGAHLKQNKTVFVEEFKASRVVSLIVVNNNFTHNTVFGFNSNNSGIGWVNQKIRPSSIFHQKIKLPWIVFDRDEMVIIFEL